MFEEDEDMHPTDHPRGRGINTARVTSPLDLKLSVKASPVMSKCCCNIFVFLFLLSCARPSTSALVKEQPLVLKYHNGALLKGKIALNLVWYGKFAPSQRSIVVDFLQSLSSDRLAAPSAASWWRTTERYKKGASAIVVGRQILRENYPLGKSLIDYHLRTMALSNRTSGAGSVTVVVTSSDVVVKGFCMNRCATHWSSTAGKARSVLIWVGNSDSQCPGYCAWPFHKPVYGPQTPPLLPPNADVGVDGIIVNLATALAGAVTNLFNDGFYQGPGNSPVYEAVTACSGIFGKGAYPGYPGQVHTDQVTGASYNAHGVNGRKFLLPAMWDPIKTACAPLV